MSESYLGVRLRCNEPQPTTGEATAHDHMLEMRPSRPIPAHLASYLGNWGQELLTNLEQWVDGTAGMRAVLGARKRISNEQNVRSLKCGKKKKEASREHTMIELPKLGLTRYVYVHTP
jgi:hypothetical protein